MANKKINDLTLGSVNDAMQLETDIAGVNANKINVSALKNNINSALLHNPIEFTSSITIPSTVSENDVYRYNQAGSVVVTLSEVSTNKFFIVYRGIGAGSITIETSGDDVMNDNKTSYELPHDDLSVYCFYVGGNQWDVKNLANEVFDNVTEPSIPYKLGTFFENSNLSQDADGKIRSTTQIIAEKGIDTPPGTITLGDGLNIKASGAQQINESLTTGIKYQMPYQTIDKTGTSKTFETDAEAELTNQARQPVFDTQLTSPVSASLTPVDNEIVNAIYIRTDGDIKNFRFQTISTTTGNAVDTFPNKFDWENDIGDNITGAGIHKIDLYYVGDSTPSRFLAGQSLVTTMKWDTNGGTVLGNTSDVPFYEVDIQKFTFVDLSNGGQGAEAFTDLTDTPAVIQEGIVKGNTLNQELEFGANLSDLSDTSTSSPDDGETLQYDELTNKWINNEPRFPAALSSFNAIDDINDWGDSSISYLFVNDGDILEIDTPSTTRTGDLIIAYNYNTDHLKVANINAETAYTINGAASYSVPSDSVAYFVLQADKDWKFGGQNSLNGVVFNPADYSVTEFNDVTSAGSGVIITAAERAKLNNLIPVSEPVTITSNTVITAANYEIYNNVVVEGNKTGATLVVDLPVISTLPSERVIFSFTNRSSDSSSMDIRAGSGDDINGAFFQRLKVGESIIVEKPSSGTSWLVLSEVIDRKPCYIEDDKAVTIPVDCNNVFVKYNDFATGTDIAQTLPALNTVGSGLRVYLQNADSDKTHTVTLTPNGTETIDGEADFEIAGNIELAEFVSDVDNDNWILANLHYDASATASDLELDDGTTNIGSVTKITLQNGTISGDSSNVEWTTINDYLNLPPLQQDTKGSTVTVLDPLQVYADPNVTDGVRIEIKRGEFELKHAPSYYATSSDELEIVGLTSAGVRTSKIWFDNEVKPEGSFIDIDRANKKIGLQEDDQLDPNITGGTAYLMFYRTAFKGKAESDGYIEISLQDAVSGDYLEDSNGNLIAVRKSYKTDDDLGALEITAIKKFTGIEYFQMVVNENFVNQELVIEDRTEGNSCIMIQALDTKDQTSRGLLQMENDVGVNLEWTSHYLGESTFNVNYYLGEDRPLSTIAADSGETGADGWHFYNWNQMKTGIDSNELLLEDDGTNLVGFSFGKVISAEKTQLLRGKNLDVSITLKTPNSAVNVYAAKWTGIPEQYTKAIVSGMVNDVPTTETNWTLLPAPIFCTEDPTGNPNTRTGTFTIPSDAENFAILVLPEEEVQPFNVSISEFKADTNPAFNGYFVHAPEIDGEKHLVEDDEYFECGLNNENYYSLRYTLSNTDTSMPAGKFIKGSADITANWANLGTAVDFLTFNATGEATINTSVIVYTGESVPDGGESNISFWWTKETAPGVWTKIPESERNFVAKKSVTTKTSVSLPEFKFKVDTIGDKLRLYAIADILDGAYIESLEPKDYLCKTTINFKEFVAGSADDPVTDIYIYDDLDNPWKLTIDTEGRLSTEEVV